MSKKDKREVFSKEKIAKIMLGKKKCKTDAWWENFSSSKVPESDGQGDFRVSRKSFYELFMYYIAPIFAEETII